MELAIQNPTSPFSELPPPGSQFFSVSGLKNYELTNHLGNVLSVVSDDAPTSQQADLVCSNDYFPFGSQMLERSFSSGVYRFGFNGKENDDEMKGNGNSVDFGARIYDGRLGRWMSIDPLLKKYPSRSPFIFSLCNPIYFVDYNGKEVFIHGVDANVALKALQTKTTLQLSIDVKTGLVTAVGKPTTEIDFE